MTCIHESVDCLNEYELIRKYRCDDCGGVMMCLCDRDIGERFLSHQLREGSVLETQERVPVTLGFVDDVCRECRGLPPEAHPRAEIHGQTTKIRRYYWREIRFEVFRRFADRAESAGLTPNSPFALEAQHLREEIEREVLADIKECHAKSPKYDLTEPSQAEVLARHDVEVVRIDATFAPKTTGKAVGIVDGDEIISAEEFVERRYRRMGWEVLFTESRPFHVLFGVYLWLLIQDQSDPLVQVNGVGAKMDYPALSLDKGDLLWIAKPADFGTVGYADRRATAIEEHFDSMLPPDRDELLWLFDYWTEGSAPLRDYLWAHDPADVERAATIVEVLPPEDLLRILRYLVGNYWGRYLGWPDLLVCREGEFFFAEVKASKDKLSADQKRWIADNSVELQLGFKLIKLHRAATAGS